MQGISHVRIATKIPGIRPNAKAIAAVNTVSRKSGNLRKFMIKMLRSRFSKAAKMQTTASFRQAGLFSLQDRSNATSEVYQTYLFWYILGIR